MLTIWKSREMRIADLTLHGWLPAHRDGMVGVANHQMQIGFGVQVGPMKFDPLNQSKGTVRFFGLPLPEPCDWSEVSSEALDAIDERLRQT